MKTNLLTMSALLNMAALVSSRDPRAPMADISNAAHLFGDPGYGGAPYGDIDDDYGDIEGPYGDINNASLDTIHELFGDVDDYESGSLRDVWQRIPKAARIGGGVAAGGAAAYGLGKLIANQIKAGKARRAARSSNSSIDQLLQARANGQKISRTAQLPFFDVSNAALNQAPIDARSTFTADTLKFNLDRQATDTPFESEVVPGVFGGATWTCTGNGAVTDRFYTAVFLTIGINALAGNPGTICTVNATMPTFNGSLVLPTPFSFTLSAALKKVTFVIYPWQLVTNKPLPVLGKYNNAAPILMSVTGIPSTSSVTLTIPGSLHSWTQSMRNRLV